MVYLYNPPPICLQVSDLPVFLHPFLYAGGFNCQHVDCGFDANSADGRIPDWLGKYQQFCPTPLPKRCRQLPLCPLEYKYEPGSCIRQIDSDSRLPDRQILEKFPRSQHRPSLITPPRFARPVPSKPVKQWNFRKAKWSHYITFTNKLSRTSRHLIHLIWIRHISVPVTPSALRRKNVSHVADEIIVHHIGMPSVKTSIKYSCNTLKA